MTKDSFVARFTPSLVSAETLEAIFVKREKLAARLVDLIRESALTDNKHYVLLVGPRGIGKTHLVSLVYHRVKADKEVADRLLIAWLREEEWGVSSFLDLLLRILRALHEEQDDKELAAQCDHLRTLAADQAELEAENLLKRTVGKSTLLLIAENLDEIFNGLGEQGQERLRAYIQNNPVFTILATSQSLFGGVSLRTSPFYAFFETQHLEELAFEDAVSLVAKIAENEGNEELASAVRTPRGRARIRVVHHLAGGNPRVYVIFAQLLTADSLDQLVNPVLATLDGLTPYYQSRMSFLSPQQQKLVQFLCDRRGAVPVNQIAQNNFLTPQTASSQLRKLSELGYVRSHQIGRESYYELREPLIRLCFEVKKTRGGPIRLLVDFLRLWYSRSELAEQLRSLPVEATLQRLYVASAVQTAEARSEDPIVAACLRHFRACLGRSDPEGALAATEELVVRRGSAWDWSQHVLCLARLNRPAQALGACEKAMELYPDHGVLHTVRALALSSLRRPEEALAAADRAVDLAPGSLFSWWVRGLVTSARRCHEEALRCWERVIELDSTPSVAWSERAQTLFDLGRHEEALASLERSVELERRDLNAEESLNRAALLMTLGRWEEGVEQLDHALRRHAESLRSHPVAVVRLVYNLLAHTHDPGTWRRHISAWLQLFEKHGVLDELAISVAAGIRWLPTMSIVDRLGQSWCDLWQELACGYEVMQVPLQVLDAVVDYRARRDERILTGLPTESRELVEDMIQALDDHGPNRA